MYAISFPLKIAQAVCKCVVFKVRSKVMALLGETFCWEVLDHPPYSHDLAPSVFHLFPKLKESLGGLPMDSDEEVQSVVMKWFNTLPTELYDAGIRKLVTR